MEVTFELNGTSHTVDCAPYETLLALLRRKGMVSVRFGSTSGETGASAVLIDGLLASSEVVLAA